MRLGTAISGAAALATLFVLFVPHWHRPVDGRPVSYPGSGAAQFENAEPEVARINRSPAPPPPGRWGVDDAALADPRPATQAFGNLQAIRTGTAGAFMQLHVALTQWVAPQQGCAFCHQGTDWPADGNPRKQAARDMLRMTVALNADPHVAPGSVTCFTCHRGQNVPPAAWYPGPEKRSPPFVARQEPWHESATTVRDFFPDNSFFEYFVQSNRARGVGYTVSPSPATPTAGEVARVYEVMMQMSDGIGVNCGYCHASRAFHDWSQSTPARWAGESGIATTRAINTGVLLPLAQRMPQIREQLAATRLPTTPADEAGAQNGSGLATCATCHYGMPKPLNGLDLASGFPALKGPAP